MCSEDLLLKLSYFLNFEDYRNNLDTLNLNTGMLIVLSASYIYIINIINYILDENKDAKFFWKKMIKILIDKFANQAYNSEENDNSNKKERVQNFQRDYKNEVERLMEIERYYDQFAYELCY